VLLQRPNLRITVMVITVIAMLLAAWRMLARPVLRGGNRRA
jgi:hypothetical protein